jgi:hypothetical protein
MFQTSDSAALLPERLAQTLERLAPLVAPAHGDDVLEIRHVLEHLLDLAIALDEEPDAARAPIARRAACNALDITRAPGK